MTHFKKKKKSIFISLGTCILLLISVWGYFVYDVNNRFPSPKSVVYSKGDTIDFLNLKIMPLGIKTSSSQKIAEEYPDLQSTLGQLYSDDDYKDSEIIIADFEVSNPTAQDTRIPLFDMMLELGSYGTDSDYGLYLESIDNDNTIKAGETRQVQLSFVVKKEIIDKYHLKENEIHIILSFYPYKQYIKYNWEEK